MVCIILQQGNPNFRTQEIFKSRSNINKCKESFKTHNREIGHVSKSRFKTFDQKNKLEDFELSDILRKEELLDHDSCMWLSSDNSSSPSSCYQYDSLFGYNMDLKIDAWFISLLSTQSSISCGKVLSTEVTFFDGSRVNPMEEASLVLDRRNYFDKNVVFHDDLKEEEVVSWLLNSTDNDFVSPISNSLSSITDISDEKSLFSSCSSSVCSSEIVDLEEFGTDKPLFWPYNSASDWGSVNKWDFFIMSPRKNVRKFGNSPKNHPNSEKGCTKRVLFGTQSKSSDHLDLKNTNVRGSPSKLEKSTEKTSNESNIIDSGTKTPYFWPSSCASKLDSNIKWDLFIMSPHNDNYKINKSRVLEGKTDVEKGCSRRLEFSSDLKSSTEITKCTKTIEVEREEVNGLTKKPMKKHKIVLEDLLLVEKLNAEDAIERVLGLGEFDGHEGIESEFDKDEFSLVQILF